MKACLANPSKSQQDGNISLPTLQYRVKKIQKALPIICEVLQFQPLTTHLEEHIWSNPLLCFRKSSFFTTIHLPTTIPKDTPRSPHLHNKKYFHSNSSSRYKLKTSFNNNQEELCGCYCLWEITNTFNLAKHEKKKKGASFDWISAAHPIVSCSA